MKKFLLFIVVLFGILSVQSLAVDYGCGENVPPSVCGADGSNNQQSTTPYRYNGAIAVNSTTGFWASSILQTSMKEATKSVLSVCGENCKLIKINSSQCSAVAFSKNESILAYDTEAFAFGDTRRGKSEKKALTKCQKNGGKNCIILITACADGS